MLLEDLLKATLDARRRDAQFRQRLAVRPIDATHVLVGGQRLTNFASNDYLGLTHHPRVIHAVQRPSQSHGVGAGASALISGYTDLHASAESAIARWKGTESAILLPSGYQANLAAVQTLTASAGRRAVRFLVDKLAHASLVDAVRASGAAFRVFPHNGLEKLARLVRDADAAQLQVVVTESVFSMDGDVADLVGLAELKERLGFVLLLDEAHASGVYGPNGSGYAAECGLAGLADVTVVTLSKALGCVGGAVCGSRAWCDGVLNLGRAYIYSTSIPASIAAAAEAALAVLRDEPERQQRLRANARHLRALLAAHVLPGSHQDCPIVPILLAPHIMQGQSAEDQADDQAAPGSHSSETPALDRSVSSPADDVGRALLAAERLRAAGFLVLPIRPPTVPPGTSRLRITLSSQHTTDEIDALAAAVRTAVGWVS